MLRPLKRGHVRPTPRFQATRAFTAYHAAVSGYDGSNLCYLAVDLRWDEGVSVGEKIDTKWCNVPSDWKPVAFASISERQARILR
ncbi:hypothetical protein MesoLj131b_73080 (plasmid) [Mesorhizobium sp. 131-2-5]|nr:hypothetical protein MesoLj131b_73080 [Mesorhizobium sp. 131-2-5]